jgi:putative transport protein
MDDRSVKRLQAHLKLAISISLSIGLAIGSLKVVGFGLENITATLLGAVAISRLRITTSLNVKPVFFILFIFTIGYGVGPQFVGGFMEEGPGRSASRSSSSSSSCSLQSSTGNSRALISAM